MKSSSVLVDFRKKKEEFDLSEDLVKKGVKCVICMLGIV